MIKVVGGLVAVSMVAVLVVPMLGLL